MSKRFIPLILAGVALAAVPLSAQAYVGPGAGISLLGALWALIAVIGSAILYIVLWPLRRMRKRRKQKKNPDQMQRDATAPQENGAADVKEGE